MARTLLLAVVLVPWLLAGPASAQPTFKSGVDLVRFDIRVVDEAGRPVTDLRQDEVRILENGRELPIVLFQRVTEPAESYVDAAIRAVTAEVSTNEAFPRGHLYILIFDQQHITPGNEQRARLAAEQFIRRRVRPSDRVALYAIPGPGPQIGFTADRLRAIQELASIRGSYQRLVSSPLGTLGIYEAHRVAQGDEQLISSLIGRLTGESDVAPGSGDPLRARLSTTSPEDPAVTRRVLQENARAIVNQTDGESRQFLQRLADVIAGFRDIEGRKTVVLFSEGFFPDNLSRELEAVAAAAAQSYCVFYTFDLNQRANTLGEAYAPDASASAEIQARIAPLSTLAIETDGALVVDAAARSQEALNALAAQAQDYYLVGFTPSERARLNRGKYQRVEVRVTRPGARASARTGYTVRPETTAADRKRAIDAVVGAPFVQQGLRVDYTTYILKAPEAGRHRVVLSLSVDLPVRSAPGDAADVVFVVRDTRDGRVAASGAQSIPLPAAPRPGSPLGTALWAVQFTLPAGRYLMRAVVREPGGLIGSADRRLDIRPLDSPEVTASDLVLGSALGGLPVRSSAFTGDGLAGALEIYGRTEVQLEGLDVKIELRQSDGHAVTAMAADLYEARADETGLSRRARFLLPLEGVAPGAYTAHAIVRARGEVVAERTRQVDVIDGRAPAVPAADAGGDGAAAGRGADREQSLGSLNPEPASVAPVEVLRGALAERYVALLGEAAGGTAVAAAAAHAAQGRWEVVEVELRRVADQNVFAAQALAGLALFAREDYGGAVAALERAQAAEAAAAPHFDAARRAALGALTAFFLGWAYEGAGEPSKALSAWRRAAYLDPMLVSAHLALAEGYVRLSQPALAIQALKAGLAAVPGAIELEVRLRQIERR